MVRANHRRRALVSWRRTSMLALCLVIVPLVGAGAVAGVPRSTGAVVASPESRPAETWSRAFRRQLESLRAAKRATGFEGHVVADLPWPDKAGHLEAIGWSGESVIILLLSYGTHRGAIRAYDISTRAGVRWDAEIDLPDREVSAYTFHDEASRFPVLLAWAGSKEKVVWGARVNCALRKVVLLTEEETELFGRRVERLSPVNVREDLANRGELLGEVEVISGTGRSLRSVRLPTHRFFACELRLPIRSFYRASFKSNRSVAYGADPPLFLFGVFPDILLLDSLQDGAARPTARIQVGDSMHYDAIQFGNKDRRTWGAMPEVGEACVSVNGESVAFVRLTTTMFVAVEEFHSAAYPRVSDNSRSDLWELYVASPSYGICLIDATMKARWNELRRTAADYLSEPPDVGRGDWIHLSHPCLSPSGSRVAYVKNGRLWIAESNHI